MIGQINNIANMDSLIWTPPIECGTAMMRDFNDLQFFAAVVIHRGFSAAARALGVPKSRMSRRVALLEERLGVRLLDRTTRGLGLTQVGQEVFEHARAAVIEAEAAEEAALRMQSEPRGLVRLSCPLGFQRAIAGPLPGFLAAYPQLRVQCIATNRRVDLIHEGVDIAIRVRERLDTDADLQMKRIGVSRRILVASPSLLAKTEAPMSPIDLANFPTLFQEEQSNGAWQLTAENGEVSNVPIEPRLASGSLDILIAAACGGAGIALLPAACCQESLATGALVRVLPEWSGTDGILHLVFVSRRGMLPSVRAVLDFASAALRSSATS
jgi:DNA-binding transcriptional LysR family regulator